MNKKSGISKDAADKLVKGIKRKTRKQYSAEGNCQVLVASVRAVVRLGDQEASDRGYG